MIHQLRTGFFCIALALLGVATVRADDGPAAPPPVNEGPGPLVGGETPPATNSIRAFRGTWTLLPAHNQGAITSGGIIIIVTTEGRVFGSVWTGEESQSFASLVNRSGAFRAMLNGGGHLQGQIGDENVSGKIFHGRRPISWIATPVFIDSTEFSLGPPPPPPGPPPPYQEERPYEGPGPLIIAR